MNFKVLGVGEVLWDLLPTGPQLGGAPANFACHARALGAEAGVTTRVGSDEYGATIFERFKEMGISNSSLQVDKTAPTGTVTVELTGNGIPHFTIHENVAWDRLEATPAALEAARQADAICFGSLAQRKPQARASIQRLVAAASHNALRVFDVNLRQRYYSREVIEQSLGLATALKLNDAELPVLAAMFGLAGTIPRQIQEISRLFGLQVIALTRGPAGSLLFRSGQWSDCPSAPIDVIDTVGAGDAFTAALVLGLLQEMELDELNSLANEVARFVCSFAGATPPLPKRFSEKFAARRRNVAPAIKRVADSLGPSPASSL
jgi:fructokinase